MSFGNIPTPSETELTLDFWPELAIAEFQRDYKINADFDENTVTLNVKHAAFSVINELKKEEQLFKEAGFNHLEEVPQGSILNELELCAFFKHAVFSMAKAKIYPQVASSSRKETSENLAQYQTETTDYWQAESRRALSAIKRQPYITVELL